MTGNQKGKKRTLKSCVGNLSISQKQALKLDVKPYARVSPLLEKCCLRVSANASYENAESDIEALTGVKVSDTTLHRQVLKHEYQLPEARQTVSEISIDGGKVRLRTGSKESQVSGAITKEYDYRASIMVRFSKTTFL